jgi:uncharacterized protein
MEVTSEFQVALSVADAWTLLTDLEQLAPLLPGAELSSSDNGEYSGSLKVHVGTLTSTFRGTVRFDELDPDFGRVVLHAVGHEARGSGTASAVVTCSLSQSGGVTAVKVAGSVEVTGKMAQFPDDTLAEAALKLVAQFVTNLGQRAALATAADQVIEAALDEVVEELDEEVAEKMADAAGEAAHEESEPEGAGAGGGEDVDAEAAEEEAEEALVEELAEAVVEELVAGAVEELVEALGEEVLAEMGPEAVEELVEELVEVAAAELAIEILSDADGEQQADDEDEAENRDDKHPRSSPPEAIDLGSPGGRSLARRVVPFASIAGGFFLLRIIIYALRRRKR